MDWGRELWEGFLDLFFPRSNCCPLCGEVLPPGGEAPCPLCRSKVALVLPPFCPRCGKPLAGAGNCPDCRGRVLPFREARAAGVYEGVLREVLHLFKYGGEKDLLPYLHHLLRECLESNPLPDIDVVIPVPLHRQREIERGFNQAALLAGGVARYLHKPLDCRSLARRRPTPPTSGLSRRQREEALRGAFVSRGRRLQGKNVLLVDDICTTGTTAAECSAALLRGGALRVYVVTVATVTKLCGGPPKVKLWHRNSIIALKNQVRGAGRDNLCPQGKPGLGQ